MGAPPSATISAGFLQEVFNSPHVRFPPSKLLGTIQSEAFRDRLPAAVGHTDACWK